MARSAALAIMLLWQPAHADTSFHDSGHLISYEATSALITEPDEGGQTYSERAAIADAAADTIVPALLAVTGIDPSVTQTQVTPGGWMLATNASIQTRAMVDDDLADSFAAAAGYVFRQSSVLVTDFAAEDPDTGYVVVGFESGTLDAGTAQAFFEHAAGVDDGLGGGYTAFGDAMIFLNVRGADGPYSGLDDDAFADALTGAAETFAADADISAIGRAEARFISNDWQEMPDGAAYLDVLETSESGIDDELDLLHRSWAETLLNGNR